MPILFYENEQQRQVATHEKEHMEERYGKIHTTVTALDVFYLAEDYHQKYYLQYEQSIAVEYRKYYPDFQGFIDSTATAKVNGYIAGYGKLPKLLIDLPKFGLSNTSGQRLMQLLERYEPGEMQ